MKDDMGERTMTNTTNANGEREKQCTRSDEEAGSVVLHVSSDMNEKDKDDEEADGTAAAKETEEISSKEDVEIRRLIEETRNTPEEEKQRLKEVSKCINDVSKTTKKKNEKTTRHPTNTRRLLRVKNIPGIKSAKKRVLIT